MKLRAFLPMAALLAASAPCALPQTPPKRVVFLAGNLSHPAGMHEYLAGCLLLQKCLAGVPGLATSVYPGGWPTIVKDGKTVDDDSAFDGTDAIVVYSDGYKYADGAPRHPLLQDDRLAVIGKLMRKGVGLGLIHWSLEPTPELGEKEFIDWVGGAFEVNWSVNPIWTANFTSIPESPVTRGVQPFSEKDEWHFHFRFRDGMKGITPILEAVPPKILLKKHDGLRSGNPAEKADVANGVPQILMWILQRDDGGRGFGFAGGHTHLHWGDDNQRKLILNSILWIAHMEVPPDGVQSTVTDAELRANVDWNSHRKFQP